MSISLHRIVGVLAALFSLAFTVVLLIELFFIRAGKHAVALKNPTDQFSTSLTAAECLHRIRSLTFPARSLAETTLMTKIQGSRFVLHRGSYRAKGLGKAFHGEVVAAGNGVRIQGAFRMHPFAGCFWAYWFGVWPANGVSAFSSTYGQVSRRFKEGQGEQGKERRSCRNSKLAQQAICVNRRLSQSTTPRLSHLTALKMH